VLTGNKNFDAPKHCENGDAKDGSQAPRKKLSASEAKSHNRRDLPTAGPANALCKRYFGLAQESAAFRPVRSSQLGARKGSISLPRLLSNLALVRADDAYQVRFQPAAPLAFGDALEGLDSLRRHGLAAVETGLAEARTDQCAHGASGPLLTAWITSGKDSYR
jgi:hypothetical protein